MAAGRAEGPGRPIWRGGVGRRYGPAGWRAAPPDIDGPSGDSSVSRLPEVLQDDSAGNQVAVLSPDHGDLRSRRPSASGQRPARPPLPTEGGASRPLQPPQRPKSGRPGLDRALDRQCDGAVSAQRRFARQPGVDWALAGHPSRYFHRHQHVVAEIMTFDYPPLADPQRRCRRRHDWPAARVARAARAPSPSALPRKVHRRQWPALPGWLPPSRPAPCLRGGCASPDEAGQRGVERVGVELLRGGTLGHLPITEYGHLVCQ